MKTSNKLIAAAAIAGIVAGVGAMSSVRADHHEGKKHEEKNKCKESCKGKDGKDKCSTNCASKDGCPTKDSGKGHEGETKK